MKKENITQFNYEIQGDNVFIHCHFKDETFESNELAIYNDVTFSWSVPASDIDGMEDPTDYLQDAIVAANS